MDILRKACDGERCDILRKDQRWNTFFVAIIVVAVIETIKFFTAIWFNAPWLMYTPVSIFFIVCDVLGLDSSTIIGHLPLGNGDIIGGIAVWIVLTVVELALLWYYTGWYTFLALPVFLVHIPIAISYFTIIFPIIGSLPWMYLPLIIRKLVTYFNIGFLQ